MNPCFWIAVAGAMTVVFFIVNNHLEEKLKRQIVLFDLARHPRSRGLEIVRRHERSLKRGSIYVTLHWLESKGFVDSEEVDLVDDPQVQIKRRCYWLTQAGLQHIGYS